MEGRRRNLRTMLTEAKDRSELMVDLAYAALYFGDPDMAEEVDELNEDLQELASDMRSTCVLGARNLKEAEAMASVLQVIDCIQRIAGDAVDIARIVTHRLGIPRELVADLSNAEEISHRVLVRDGSHMAHRPLEGLELPTVTGMRITAVRRGREWMTDDIDGDLVLRPNDVLFLQGPPAGITRLRELAGAPYWHPPQHPQEDVALSDLDRAVDVLVEMKNVSEAAVGLAYSALLLADQGLAAEVTHLEDRLDEMREQLELWVLRAGAETVDPAGLRGLLHLGKPSEEVGDAAQQLVWLVEAEEEMHPVLAAALGDSDEVFVQFPVAAGSDLAGEEVTTAQVGDDTGFHLLAIRRDGRYFYRPRRIRLTAGDEILATGPWEGRAELASQCGYVLVADDDTGAVELLPAE